MKENIKEIKDFVWGYGLALAKAFVGGAVIGTIIYCSFVAIAEVIDEVKG